MQSGNVSVAEGSNPRLDEAFQKLLLTFSNAAAQGTDPSALIRLFCQATRDFFHVDGTYFLQFDSAEELVGTEADGLFAERFRGMRVGLHERSLACEAILNRRTGYVNRVDPVRYPLSARFQAKSMMAAPLMVANEVIGAAVFMHASEEAFFTDDLAAKATILAGQLGSLLEASRLNQVSREEHRKAEILADVAQALHAVPDSAAVIEAVADRLRALLRTHLVCVLLKQGSEFTLRAVSTESPQLSSHIRARYEQQGRVFAGDLAAKAIAAGEPITVAIDPASLAVGDEIPPGTLIVAPFRTSQTQGAVLVYPRAEGPFTAEDKSLVASVAGFGAVAIANAELYAVARGQAHELHQLVEISSDLGSMENLNQFLQQFSLRAADFLGFTRAFIGMVEDDGVFHVRWGADHGRAALVDLVFPEGIASKALHSKEVFWSDDPKTIPGANLAMLELFDIRQLLAVPLLNAEGKVLGMFGVLDRKDRSGISPEDIRRAKALAAQVSVALQVTRSLHTSEQHRQRAESLIGLALDLNGSLRLPEFARRFVTRVAALTKARAAALAVNLDSGMEVLFLQDPNLQGDEKVHQLRLARALNEALASHSGPIVFASAKGLFGPDVAASLGWEECSLVRLQGASGELAGVLCLADREKSAERNDEQILQAVAGHGSIALENSRLFTRMDRANRHWVEIFDAISDFIVVHDEQGDVLRVNRSLADFIGVQPAELIGIKMCALLAMDADTPVRSCPFCHAGGEAADEYVHPVLERTYLVSTSRVHGPDEGLQTIHVLKDITDRREAERRYRELFDNIQEGIYFSTQDGRFIEVNDAMARMLGYNNREELLQVDIPSHLYYSHDERMRALQVLDERGSLRNYESTLRRKDGSPIHVLINAFAVRDPNGRVLQYRGLMLDISGVKAFQAELQRERDFSSKILNNTQSLILVADTAGLVSYANRRWIDMGYEHAQIVGKPLDGLVAVSRRQTLVDAYAATLAGHQVDNLDLQILRGDGRIGHFSVNLSPMRDEQSNVTSVVVVMTDITDAASLQAKLVHAEKLAAVGQLVSGVAHEVNNPLTAILGFADLLMENPDVPESARKDLRVVLQEAQRTKQIVQNLLSFARQMPPQRKPVQLNSILHRTVQLRAYDFHSHGVQVTEQLDQDLPYVIGDSHQLQQVFLNIVNNAYDAVRETGRPARIEIATSRMGGFVEVAFRDNGQGISHPDRIFDPFFTTKEVGKGTGLGLSICYGIVHEHGGEISCHNNASGEGATFVVRLPSAPEMVSTATAGVTQR